MNKTITALVPMRHHSQRVPGKNFRLLDGRPLYAHILATLQAVPEITQILVDTDSPEIIEGLKTGFPDVKCVTRPENLRADTIPMNEILMYDSGLVKSDFFLQTHSTNPLLKAETVSRAIQTLLAQFPAYDSLFSVTRFQSRFWDGLGRAVNHNPNILLQTQDLPPIYEENSCLYLFTRETLAVKRNRLGDRPYLFEIDADEAWDIDEEIDFKIGRSADPSKENHPELGVSLNRKLVIVIQVVLVLATLAGSIYVAVTPANSLMNWYNVDDAFFYYKVAQNVLAGHGFTFDQINLSNGFHPLWMVVCLSVFWLSRFNLLLPLRVLVIVSGLFNAATSLLLFRFLKRYLHIGAAFAGALCWGLYPSIYNVSTVLGMESAISIFFIILLISKAASFLNRSDQDPYRVRDLILLGVIGGLTILARLDNIFVVAVIGLFLLFKIKKIPATVIFDILAITVSIFVAWILRLGSEGVVANKLSIYPMLMLCLLIRPIALYFSGCYLSKKPLKKLQMVIRIILAWGAAFVIEYVVLFVLYKLKITAMFSNSIMVLEAGIGLITVIIVHLALFKTTVNSEYSPIFSFWKWVKSIWKPVLLDGVLYGSPIALLLGSYMIFNKITFGSFTPVSGQIKHWWSTLPNTVYARSVSLLDALGLSTGGPWSVLTSKIYELTEFIAKPFASINLDILFIFVGAIAIALFLLLMKAQNGKLARKFFTMMIPAVLIGCIIQITYYFATGYTHTRGWYWLAEMMTIVLSGSLVLDGIFSWLDQVKLKIKPSSILVFLASFVLVFNHFSFLLQLAPMVVPEEKQAAYLAEVKEVEFLTQPDSKIGMTGGGLIAYFIHDRTVVNLDGLINSVAYFNAMKAGKATQFLDAIPLNYVFGKPYMLLSSDPYSSFLKDRLVEIGFIRGNESFTLFKYRIIQ